MTIDISKFKQIGKRQLGTNLTLFYAIKDREVIYPSKVLMLKNVAMTFDIERDSPTVTIELKDKTVGYAFDTAMRLQREEVQWFKEVTLFNNATPPKRTFKAVAESIEWRDFQDTDNFNP